MSLNIGKKLLIALIVVAVLFAAQSVFDGNVALAAGPETCAIPTYDRPASGGKGDVHIEWAPPIDKGDVFLVLVKYAAGMTEQEALNQAYKQEIRVNRSGGNVFGRSSTDTDRYIVVGHWEAQWGVVAVLDVQNNQQNQPHCYGNPFAVEVAPPAEVADEKDVTKVVTGTVLDADAQVRSDVDPCARMRKGPGTAYERVTCLAPGKGLSVVGKNADGSWVQVSSNAGKGWVSADLLVVNVDLMKVTVVEVPPVEVAAGVVVTPTTVVTPTVAITPTVKSLCDRCWEIRLEAPVITETVATAAKLNRPITLTAESVVIVSADGEAELLVYVENTTVLEPSGSTSILVTKTASVKDRGVKIIARKGDSVLDLWQKVYGPNATPPTLQDIINLTTTNGTTFNVGFDDAGNPVFTVIEGTQLLFTCNAA